MLSICLFLPISTEYYLSVQLILAVLLTVELFKNINKLNFTWKLKKMFKNFINLVKNENKGFRLFS